MKIIRIFDKTDLIKTEIKILQYSNRVLIYITIKVKNLI